MQHEVWRGIFKYCYISSHRCSGMYGSRREDTFIACDFASAEATFAFLDKFDEERKPFLKIGMELFYAEGPSIVRGRSSAGDTGFSSI